MLRVLRIGDNFIDSALDITLIERLTHVTELNLFGNRLSHASMNRAAQTCTRNRQRARDEGPHALRAEMHRLLFQETKLETARQQVGKDDTEISVRQSATGKAAQELRNLRATEGESQKQLARQIEAEENTLGESRARLAQIKKDLVDSKEHYAQLSKELRDTLREREQELVELQVKCSDLDEHFARRKKEHPQEVANVKRQIATAQIDAERHHAAAKQMREQVAALNDKSLVDFKP